jgi:hypothetical protein
VGVRIWFCFSVDLGMGLPVAGALGVWICCIVLRAAEWASAGFAGVSSTPRRRENALKAVETMDARGSDLLVNWKIDEMLSSKTCSGIGKCEGAQKVEAGDWVNEMKIGELVGGSVEG